MSFDSLSLSPVVTILMSSPKLKQSLYSSSSFLSWESGDTDYSDLSWSPSRAISLSISCSEPSDCSWFICSSLEWCFFSFMECCLFSCGTIYRLSLGKFLILSSNWSWLSGFGLIYVSSSLPLFDAEPTDVLGVISWTSGESGNSWIFLGVSKSISLAACWQFDCYSLS